MISDQSIFSAITSTATATTISFVKYGYVHLDSCLALVFVFVYFFLNYCLVVTTSAVGCLERFVLEMIGYSFI